MRLSSRGCYFLIEGRQERQSNVVNVARLLQVEIRFVVRTKAQMLAVILS